MGGGSPGQSHVSGLMSHVRAPVPASPVAGPAHGETIGSGIAKNGLFSGCVIVGKVAFYGCGIARLVV